MVLSVGSSYCLLPSISVQRRLGTDKGSIVRYDHGENEGFKEYTQKWRDLASRVQPPLTDREHIDMFKGTLSGPFFNLLVGCSSSGFTELILIGERVESCIKTGKIFVAYTSTPNPIKKPFATKKEVNVVYGARAHTEK